MSTTSADRAHAPQVTAHDQYNRDAVKFAEKITAERKERRRERDHTDLDVLFPAYNRVPLGVAREWERMGSQHVSDELRTMADAAGARLEHLGVTIGTVIHGVNLAAPTPEVVALTRATLLERKVVGFRDQALDDASHIAFARHFGDLDAFPFGAPGDDPFVLEIHHNERSPGAENGWHTDVTWMETPSLGSIARIVQNPDAGGDTLFADSHAACLGLPAEVYERLVHVDGTHDYRAFLAGLSDSLVDEVKSAIPFGVTHPLVRTHPETGKAALYLHGGFLRHDSLVDRRTGERLDDSVEVVRLLLAQHARPEYQCRFQWEPGSVAFWDNRASQHYATSDYYPSTRVLRRVTIAGDRPFGEADSA